MHAIIIIGDNVKFINSKLFYFLLGIILSGGIVYAATSMSADKISYTKQDGTETTVDLVLNDLYNLADSDHFSSNFLTSNFHSSFKPGTLKTAYGGTISNDNIILSGNGSVQYGPDVSFSAGCYFVLYSGSNLDNENLEFDFYDNTNHRTYSLNKVTKYDHFAYYYFNLESNTSDGEVRLWNRSSTETTQVNSIILFYGATCPSN